MPKTIGAAVSSVRDLIRVVEELAPPAYAETWDNVGLIAGEASQPLSAVLLTIDLTAEVVREAEKAKCNAVLAYHPPIFVPQKRLAGGSPVWLAARAGLALYSVHTALDAAPGGTNDTLAELLELREARALRPSSGPERDCKLVVFVPRDAVARVSEALFAAGAGQIGHYEGCSFATPGLGTFRGDETTHPALGEPERRESVEELRLETILPTTKIDAALAALATTHPYETPAFDLVRLIPAPLGYGMGRIGALEHKLPLDELCARVKQRLGLAHLWIAGPRTHKISRVAVCAGAGGDLIGDALRARADAFVTGELRHHDALRAASHGLAVICTGHSNCERPALARLRERLQAALPHVEVLQSQVDRDPFEIV